MPVEEEEGRWKGTARTTNLALKDGLVVHGPGLVSLSFSVRSSSWAKCRNVRVDPDVVRIFLSGQPMVTQLSAEV